MILPMDMHHPLYKSHFNSSMLQPTCIAFSIMFWHLLVFVHLIMEKKKKNIYTYIYIYLLTLQYKVSFIENIIRLE